MHNNWRDWNEDNQKDKAPGPKRKQNQIFNDKLRPELSGSEAEEVE